MQRKESTTYSFHWHRSHQSTDVSVQVSPLVPGCMLVTVSAIRLTISPPTCVPIAAAGDSGHTFLQPTLNTQLLTLGCQADPSHWWPGEITLQTAGCRSTSASSPSPVTTWHHPLRRGWSWGMMAVGHEGMMAWWQGFPWHPVECRLVSHARCHCKQIYCLMRLGMN